MYLRVLTTLAFGAALLAGAAQAQDQKPNPLDAVPDKMPFSQAYGAPIGLASAQQVLAAAEKEAKGRGWALNCAVLDSGANLVAFARMDGAQLGSIAIAEHKARAAVKYRRETKAFENGVQSGLNYQLTLDDVIASRGGIPLVRNDKIIGSVGCSGGTGSQDEVVAKAGAGVINK